MRVERGQRPVGRAAAVGAEVDDRRREGQAGRYVGRVDVGRLGPVGEAVGEAVVLALFDVVQLLRRVGAGPLSVAYISP